MIKKSTLSKALSGIALASVFALTSCQKEELMEGQFVTETAYIHPQHGQVIPGQYIVVFKNSSSNLSATGVNALSMSGRVVSGALRERLLTSAGIERSAVEQHFEGTVNGFAARLSAAQLHKLGQSPDVAYIEQDRVLMLSKPATNGNGQTKDDIGTINNGKGKEKKTKEPTSEAPIASDPVAKEPTQPAPVETAPVETAPSPYTKITPLAGENLTWNIAMNGFGDGTGKTVWVIDSGIDTDHPDLNVDLQRSVSLIYGDESVEDGFGHGTVVAGVIAAKNNGSGVIGVAANATIVALRVFDNSGYGTMSRAINAVNYINHVAQPGDVVNMSLGGGISSTLDNAIIAAASKGILFAIAAGNSAVDCSANSPARVDAAGVYTVSAMDRYQNFWSSSNYGAPVDFAAPGVSITSTKIGGGIGSAGSGTSLAAPHVAGILLLRGEVFSQGTVIGDKDSWPDPIASVE